MTMSTAAKPAQSAKREAILRAATELFAQRGYAGAEMETIGQAAGVAKGTLYLYFKSKEELFLAAVDHAFERLVEFVFEAIVCLDEPLAIVRTSFRAIARFCEKRPDVMSLLAEERTAFRDRPPRVLFHGEKNRPYFADVVRRGIESGVFRDTDPDAAVQTLSWLMQGLIFASRQDRSTEQLVPRAEQAIEMVLHGLLRRPGE